MRSIITQEDWKGMTHGTTVVTYTDMCEVCMFKIPDFEQTIKLNNGMQKIQSCNKEKKM